jgi:hypothetical protein
MIIIELFQPKGTSEVVFKTDPTKKGSLHDYNISVSNDANDNDIVLFIIDA